MQWFPYNDDIGSTVISSLGPDTNDAKWSNMLVLAEVTFPLFP